MRKLDQPALIVLASMVACMTAAILILRYVLWADFYKLGGG